MKKIIAILVLSLFLLFQAVAQDDEEEKHNSSNNLTVQNL